MMDVAVGDERRERPGVCDRMQLRVEKEAGYVSINS